MKKTISLFVRDHSNTNLVLNQVTPGAEWVANGEGVATVKLDGTCCLIRDNVLYKRYDAKRGKTPPTAFEPAQEEPDPHTGHWPGWIPVGAGPEDAAHREAFHPPYSNGTYELCGPKIQSNPEKLATHALFRHGERTAFDAPRTFNELATYFVSKDIEGIVWHHEDGRVVKIKAKDFGIKRT